MSMNITEGIHTFTGKCPDCGRTQTFPLELGVQRTTSSLSGATKLRIEVSTKAAEHSCNGEDQAEMDFAEDDE
jgi:hypothetical protein